MTHPGETEAPISTPILFGTVEGAIGMVCQVPDDFYKFLIQLEAKLAKVVRSVGKIDHQAWRSFYTERRTELPSAFVDGDLIESFLDLPREKMQEVVQGLQIDEGASVASPGGKTTFGRGLKKEATVDDLVKIVEELSRIH